MADYKGRWTTVRVEVEESVGWVTLNRPEKRNAMSPTLNREMREILETLELDGDMKVLVLTGAGESWTAGMDLKEYFREIDQAPEIVQEKIRRDASTWQWKLLRMYSKPTIAMVNGWCFGGAFIPLDFAPAWIRQASYVMPLRYLVTGMQDVMARGEGPAAAVPGIVIMLGITAVFTLIAVRVFRWDDV